MASKERIKTNYPGVWYADRNSVRTFYINYRKPGDRKKIEEKLGTNVQGWSAAEANARPQRVGGRAGCEEAWGVSLRETAGSADPGGSSKYSNENFED